MSKDNGKKIELPRYNWFYSNQQGKWVMNSYSGSRGTSSANGCLCNTTFNYRVYIKSKGDGESIIQAECFFIAPVEEESKRSEVVVEEFENSENGLEAASRWLYEKSIK